MLVLLKRATSKFSKLNSNEYDIANTNEADNNSKPLPKQYTVLLN